MNDGLQRELTELAEREGRTFTDVVEEAAALLLSSRRERSASSRRITLPVSHSKLNLPDGMTLDQYIKKLQEDEDLELLRKMTHGDA
jgi:hypothetical protein